MVAEVSSRYERMKVIIAELSGKEVTDENYFYLKDEVYKLPVNLYDYTTEIIVILLASIAVVLLLFLYGLTKSKIVFILILLVGGYGAYTINDMQSNKEYDTNLGNKRSEMVQLENEIQMIVQVINKTYPSKIVYIQPVDFEMGELVEGYASVKFTYNKIKIEGKAKVIEYKGLAKPSLEGYFRVGSEGIGEVPNYIKRDFDELKVYIPKGD